MGKCPPGVICIENFTVLMILFLIVIIIYILFNHVNQPIQSRGPQELVLNVSNTNPQQQRETGLFARPAFSFSNVENDVLLNPYQAPLRDNRIYPDLNMDAFPNKVPINVATQSYDSTYRQIGILTRIGTKETILPLLGRPLITNRNSWNFYTMSESNNLLKLPISHNGRKCMTQTGCNDLHTGDTVNVDGYNDAFKVTTYENNLPQYIPFI